MTCVGCEEEITQKKVMLADQIDDRPAQYLCGGCFRRWIEWRSREGKPPLFPFQG